jgi:GNAT superfamily N-acetyltransferase
MQLRVVAPSEYARLVLPLSAQMWAGRRDLQTYVSQTLEIARGRYGLRSYRTIGLYEGSALLASCKRYERIVRVGRQRLHVVGIGAVFTPTPLRGRGYASAMLGMALDSARSSGADAIYLFSDIRPHFYEQLGFRLQPSRTLTLRADALPKSRIEIARFEERDWPCVQRCFSLLDRARPWSLVRTPLAWDWVRTRLAHGSEHVRGAAANFVVRWKGGVRAYVIGTRDPERDTYVLDEFGFAGTAGAALIPPLLRSAAGDLRRITGWLPPDGTRHLLPRGTVRDRRVAIFMIAPLTALGRKWCVLSESASPSDGVWSTDHV